MIPMMLQKHIMMEYFGAHSSFKQSSGKNDVHACFTDDGCTSFVQLNVGEYSNDIFYHEES
jgi:hypothetical protein